MNPKENEKSERIDAQKPRIVVHDSDVDFDDVSFHVDNTTTGHPSRLMVMRSEGLTEEEKEAKIDKVLPWIDMVLDYTLGDWGNATFRPEGMGLIDEVIDPGCHTGF
jgi:hypothetical protein